MRLSPILAAALLAAACSSAQPKPDPAPAPAPAAEAAVAPAPQDKYAATPATGQARVTLEGCLSAAPSEEEGARHVTRAVRGAAAPEVVVSIGGLGVIVAHEIEHACCLSARVETAVEGGELRLTEKLEGKACRCRCSSTIKTEVGLEPGDYTLVLALDKGQGPQEIHRQPVAIQKLLRR